MTNEFIVANIFSIIGLFIGYLLNREKIKALDRMIEFQQKEILIFSLKEKEEAKYD